MRKLLVVFVLITVVLCLCSCKDDEKTTNLQYELELSLEENILHGKQTVKYNNCFSDKLSESVFHLYANAYAENAENPAYAKPLKTYGGITIESVSVDGAQAETVYGTTGEYVTVKHAEKKSGETVTVEFTYTVTLPECALRLGYYDGCYNLSNFYPQLAVYGENGFRQDSFSRVGDPIFSESAAYTVNFTCDKAFVVASSVKCGAKNETADKQTISYCGANIRDFAIVCNRDFNVLSSKVGNTDVYYFYENDEFAQDTLDVAVNALTLFGNTFGAYEYNSFSVVRTPFDYEGMEYSGLIYVSEKSGDVIDTVIHETAHQWWYGMVGNDCINQSVLDEGLVTFCTAYYYELNGETEKFNQKMSNITKAYTLYEKLQKRRKSETDLRMNNPIYCYNDYQYTMVIYYKGAMMFNNLYEIYGKEKFNACLKKYFENNKYKIATLDDFAEATESVVKADVKGLLNGWLGGNVVATTFAS